MSTMNSPGVTVIPDSSDQDCSALISVTASGTPTAICRLGKAEDMLGRLTVRQLLERVVSPNSLLSLSVPMTQLEAETPTAIAISQLLASDSCRVVFLSDSGDERQVALDEPALAIAQAQTGAQGSAFVSINLEVRSLAAPEDEAPAEAGEPAAVEPEPSAGGSLFDLTSPTEVEERRQLRIPDVVEVTDEQKAPGATASPAAEAVAAKLEEEIVETVGLAALAAVEKTEGEAQSKPEAVRADAAGPSIMTIVAGPAPRSGPAQAPQERKEYVRKTDWLRAQFLPEVQALDFSGLFVGNLGLGIREEQARRNVVLADPARITEILLRGNSYRRSADHAKALICYQELVDMDPSNADFRFLLGKTLIELGQQSAALEALNRAKELGHDGARKELEAMKSATQRGRSPLGFLRFWKQ